MPGTATVPLAIPPAVYASTRMGIEPPRALPQLCPTRRADGKSRRYRPTGMVRMYPSGVAGHRDRPSRSGSRAVGDGGGRRAATGHEPEQRPRDGRGSVRLWFVRTAIATPLVGQPADDCPEAEQAAGMAERRVAVERQRPGHPARTGHGLVRRGPRDVADHRRERSGVEDGAAVERASPSGRGPSASTRSSRRRAGGGDDRGERRHVEPSLRSIGSELRRRRRRTGSRGRPGRPAIHRSGTNVWSRPSGPKKRGSELGDERRLATRSAMSPSRR